MRRFSHSLLLVAPVILASVGCASKPAWMVSRGQPAVQATDDRFDRLIDVAEKYEKQGKPDVAKLLYQQILVEEPTNAIARNRVAIIQASEDKAENFPQPVHLKKSDPMLAQSSQSNRQLASKPAKSNDKPKQAVTLEHALVTATETPKASSVEEDLFEVVANETKSAKAADQFPQPVVIDESGVETREVIIASRQSTSGELDISRVNLETAIHPTSNLPGSSATADENDTVTSAATDFAWAATDEQQSVTDDKVVSTTEQDASIPWWEAIFEEPTAPAKTESVAIAEETPPPVDSAEPPADQLFAPIEAEPHTIVEHSETEITRQFVSSEFNQTLVQPKWTPTRQVVEEPDVTEAMPVTGELVQLVSLLSSSTPSDRISGLVQLSLQGEEAKPAALEVRKLLDDPNPLVRTHAAGTIRDLEGDAWDAVHRLEELLTEDDPQVVQLAAYLLGKMGPEAMDAIDELVTVRDTGNGLARLHAAEALLTIAPDDPQSYVVLEQALAGVPVEERYFAAVTLAGLHGVYREDAAVALSAALHDEEAIVRSAAALSLGALQQHGMAALPELEYMATYDVPEVRVSAATAIACLKAAH